MPTTMPAHLRDRRLFHAILNRCGHTGIAERQRLGALARSGQNEQGANGCKPENFRHLHIFFSMGPRMSRLRRDESIVSPRRRSETEVSDVKCEGGTCAAGSNAHRAIPFRPAQQHFQAVALWQPRPSPGARSNSCAARSPCRSAGIPAHKWPCNPAPHSAPDNSADRLRPLHPDRADRSAAVAAVAGPAAAPKDRLPAARPARPAPRPARFAPLPRLPAAKQRPPMRPIMPLS
jgi:hypothetical protein